MKVLLKLILSVHRIRRWRFNLIPAESKFKTSCSIIKDKYMMKAQVHVSNSSAISGASSSSKETTLLNLSCGQITDKTRLGYDNHVFNSTVFDSDELISFESDVSMPTSLVYDRYKSREGYHVVPHPYAGTFMPPKPDLVFHDAPTVNETVPTVFNIEPSLTKPNKDLSQSNRPSSPIIED
nr:hypothetical protein [Tanacetum cinerariifolium]